MERNLRPDGRGENRWFDGCEASETIFLALLVVLCLYNASSEGSSQPIIFSAACITFCNRSLSSAEAFPYQTDVEKEGAKQIEEDLGTSHQGEGADESEELRGAELKNY